MRLGGRLQNIVEEPSTTYTEEISGLDRKSGHVIVEPVASIGRNTNFDSGFIGTCWPRQQTSWTCRPLHAQAPPMGNSNGKPIVLTDEVNLNHFRLLRVVGKGAFGKVRIVERKDSGLTFALKYIRKDEVVRSESVRNIIRERRMLEHLNHPFLCNLRYSFQDMEYL